MTIPKNYHQQFVSRNANELAEVISCFNELCKNTHNRFCLYLDMNGWEVFDQNLAVVVIRHDYRHLRDLSIDIRKIQNDFMYIGLGTFDRKYFRLAAGSARRLIKIYGYEKFTYLFPDYDIRKAFQTMANCD